MASEQGTPDGSGNSLTIRLLPRITNWALSHTPERQDAGNNHHNNTGGHGPDNGDRGPSCPSSSKLRKSHKPQLHRRRRQPQRLLRPDLPSGGFRHICSACTADIPSFRGATRCDRSWHRRYPATAGAIGSRIARRRLRVGKRALVSFAFVSPERVEIGMLCLMRGSMPKWSEPRGFVDAGWKTQVSGRTGSALRPPMIRSC